jgi:hypothetical protein
MARSRSITNYNNTLVMKAVSWQKQPATARQHPLQPQGVGNDGGDQACPGTAMAAGTCPAALLAALSKNYSSTARKERPALKQGLAPGGLLCLQLCQPTCHAVLLAETQQCVGGGAGAIVRHLRGSAIRSSSRGGIWREVGGKGVVGRVLLKAAWFAMC